MLIDFDGFFNNVFRTKFSNAYSNILIKEPIEFPDLFSMEQLVIHIGRHGTVSKYQNCAEMLIWFQQKESYRNMGLFILYFLLRKDQSEITIKIKNKQSDLKKIIFTKPDKCFTYNYLISSLVEKSFHSYKFKRRPIHRKAWDSNISIEDTPSFILKDNAKLASTEKDIKNVLYITGSENALILLADTFLNASLAANIKYNFHHEFYLEPFHAWQGAGRFSCSIHFTFPGNSMWDFS